MKVAITGGTGLLGRALAQDLHTRGDDVVVVSRTQADGVLAWDVRGGLRPRDALSGLGAVVHLAGAGVADRRWTRTRKQEILDSRVHGTRTIVAALREANPRPRVLVSASAVGYYGDAGATPLDETSPNGGDFLAGVCASWEHEADAASELDVRVVKLRLGLVLSRDGGVLARMLPAFSLGAGGPLGDGRHWMSWIHIGDAVAAIGHALDRPQSVGVYNVVAPGPVDNNTFTRALATALRRPAFMRVPRFALRVALGELSGALLASQRATPTRLAAEGFTFQYPRLPGAFGALLSR